MSEPTVLDRSRAGATRRAERLGKLTAAIANAVTSEQVYEALVDRVQETLGATSVALWLVSEDGLFASLVRQKGYLDAVAARFTRLPLDGTASSPAADSICSAEPVWIDSQADLLGKYPQLAQSVTAGATYHVSCLPLVVGGRVLGTLALTTTAPSVAASVDGERDFLLLAARYAGQAVERLRLLELERRSRAEADASALRMGLLSHASRVFVETDLELDARLQAIVLELGTTLGSSLGISLLEDGLLHTCAVYHPVPEAEKMLRELASARPISLGEGISGSVASSGESALVTALDRQAFAERAAPAYREFLARYPIYALMCAPLRTRGRVIGTVLASRTRSGETYSPADVELLEDLASRAAGAIENSRLFREAEEARRRAEQLYHFAQAVAVADDVKVVFEAALGTIASALATNRAAILTFDARKVMRFAAWRDLSDKYRALVEGHSPWPADATDPKPVLVSDVQADASLQGYAELFREEKIGALGFFPLVNRERLLGKFMVYYEAPHVFASHEVELALAIARHLASVMARFAAIASLEETVRANELFAGVLAHDLRNPLAAIVTAAQVMLMRQEGETTNDTSKPLSKILSSGQRMERMIVELLDFTRARTGGGIQIQPRTTYLDALCTQAVDELELAHPDWAIHRHALGDLRVHWDPDRVLQVLSNLIANAGQHGRRGFRVTVRLDGSAADEVTFTVHNVGAIPAELLPNVFEPFRSHDAGRDRGLGLGLFIVRQIVLAHGGTVTVSSSAETGTTFRVTMPRCV